MLPILVDDTAKIENDPNFEPVVVLVSGGGVKSVNEALLLVLYISAYELLCELNMSSSSSSSSSLLLSLLLLFLFEAAAPVAGRLSS